MIYLEITLIILSLVLIWHSGYMIGEVNGTRNTHKRICKKLGIEYPPKGE